MNINLIKSFEGFRSHAYQDSTGYWKLGYGTIYYPDGTAVAEGDSCTEAQAAEWLSSKCATIQKEIAEHVIVQLTDNQLTALVSFCCNPGIETLLRSSLLKYLNRGDYTKAAQEFPKWCRVSGLVSSYLVKRRLAEQQLFESGI
jgi:lysozyme